MRSRFLSNSQIRILRLDGNSISHVPPGKLDALYYICSLIYNYMSIPH